MTQKNDDWLFRIIDEESFPDFVDSLDDLAPAIERDIARLAENPKDREIITGLFRAVHNIKGDSGLCKIDLGVRIATPIENLLSKMREGTLTFSPLLGEVMLLALDRLEQAIEALNEGRSLVPLHLSFLLSELDTLCREPGPQIEHDAAQFIERITGFRPVLVQEETSWLDVQADLEHPVEIEKPSTHPVELDLAFFRSLALQLETRSPHLAGRTTRILALAQDINREAGFPVDEQQLDAAVYMHDVGMMFLPESVWLKVERLSEADRDLLKSHPTWAADLLGRMPYWHEASRMVREHHERLLGGGYPRNLSGASICTGAKILAIVDAFEAVNLKHSHRGHNLSALRAAAEVNACEDQFAPELIAPFNRVIRRWIYTHAPL